MENSPAQVSMNLANSQKFEAKVRRNMLLTLAGKLVSLLGTSIYAFAISLYVLKETKSGLNFALILVCATLPRVIFYPFAGAIADRFDRKKMVVIADFLSGLVVLSLYAVSMVDGLRLVYIYATSVLLATLNTFFGSAFDASMRNLVDDKRLTRLYSLNQSISSGAEIVGPVLGGLVFGFVNIHVFLLINGLSFIFSGISELFIDFNLTAKVKEEAKKQKINFKMLIADMQEGLAYIKSSTLLVAILFFALVINFFSNLGYSVPIPYIINKVLQFSSKQYGLICSMYPLGILIGALLLSVLPEGKSKFKHLGICLGIAGGTVFLLGLPAIPALQSVNKTIVLVYYIAVIFLMGVNNSLFNIPIFVALQRLIEDKYRGRVLSVLMTSIYAITPLSFLIAGFLIEIAPAYLFPLISGICLVLLLPKYLSIQQMRQL